jgi:Ti-type conjugative transfer relaxase TraA
MAIYHFSAKVISRANGSSAVASAAYRSASELHDDRIGRDHDFSNKAGVVHSEVLLPEGSPQRLSDRATLWNEVEAGEKRKDAQLAREVEFAIPRELNQRQGVELAREFVVEQFVARGMVADLNVHWDKAKDGSPKPHAHVMLALREVGPEGFAKKAREWNSPELLKDWREAWEGHANRKLAELGIDARIDHRTLEAQGIALEPQHKIGPAAMRRPGQGLEAERIEDHARIARENGAKIIADPNVALAAITRQQATFTTRDLAAFAFRHSDGKEQFDQVMGAVRTAPELVALGKDGRGQERFTSAEMIEVEGRLERSAGALAGQGQHGVAERHREAAIGAAEARGLVLSGEQRDAFEHVTGGAGLASVVGYAGSGKSAMLGVAREAWEGQGYRVRGAALSGIAAENLEGGAGIQSRTIASLEHGWNQGRDRLGPRDVLVVDEAGMIGSRQMERVVSAAREAGAKVVLVGDPEQLQAIEAGAAFRSLAERHGAVEITEVRRQRQDWQRAATRQLATERTGEALAAYEGSGMVAAAETRAAAREGLVEVWARDREASPGASRIILAHTNAEVRGLNEKARGRLREAGALGEDREVVTERGARTFAAGDRLMFLRNERELAVKNGSLGTVLAIEAGGERLTVRLDGNGQEGKGPQEVTFYTRDYAHIDHGYAATVHKAQGVTVDRAYVLATPGMDRHGAYVALSRHREGVQLHYGRDDFADRAQLVRTLARDRAKDMASDYPAGRPHADQVRAFAEAREIRFPERVRDAARELAGAVQEKARGMFAGFRPKAPAPGIDKAEGEAAGSRRQGQPEQAGGKAVQAFARAAADARRMGDKGLPVLPHQRAALDKTAAILERQQPGMAQDLARAFGRDPALMQAAAQGRMAGVGKAVTAERETRVAAEAAKQAERERTIEQERSRDRGFSR